MALRYDLRRPEDVLALRRLLLEVAAGLGAPHRRAAASLDRSRQDGTAVVGGRGRRGGPSFGWTSLTPTELRVAAMVAEGCTNPQIAARLRIGRATVKSHLDHVFAKLGVHSRARVASEHARHA